MKNAKDELKSTLRIVIGDRKIVCGYLERHIPFKISEKIILHKGYTEKELEDFFNNIDFEYDNRGFEIDGVIWFSDGSWIERTEHSNIHHWIHSTTPDSSICNR